MNDIMHRESGATVNVRVASNAIGRAMESTITSVVSSLDLKVLIEYDQDYDVYVARCLETGAVATGETPDEASQLMKQTLELDILLAIKANNLDNLFHATATPDV